MGAGRSGICRAGPGLEALGRATVAVLSPQSLEMEFPLPRGPPSSLLRPHLTGRSLPTLWETICFPRSLMIYMFITSEICLPWGLVFGPAIGYHDLAKLSHKINHHGASERSFLKGSLTHKNITSPAQTEDTLLDSGESRPTYAGSRAPRVLDLFRC